jgi:hypothetical protein
MYTFSIKDNGPDMKVLITRSLLALGAIILLLYQDNQYYLLNILSSVVLFVMAVGISWIFLKFRLNILSVLCVAAVILFIAIHSIPFSAMLVVFGLFLKRLDKNPIVTFNKGGVFIKKILGKHFHSWKEFNNIILKDALLTLDFKNNKLLQLTILENDILIDENSFNTFCNGFINSVKN